MEIKRDQFQAQLEAGRLAARVLEDAIVESRPDNRLELAVLAARIRECNRPRNAYHAEGIDEEGELRPMNGKLWQCGSKLCQTCSAAASRKNRKKLRDSISRQKLIVGERWRFLTFTIPNPNLTLLKTRGLVYSAWRLFTKRRYFRTRIRGYCKSEEFTLTRRGFHYHIHALVIARYLDYAALRTEWTVCVRAVFQAAGLELTAATADKLLIVNAQNVASLDDAINEVAKYITKSNSWQKIRHEELIEIASIQRWNRLFELGGSLKARRQKPLPSAEEAEVKAEPIPRGPYIYKTILDTEELTDGTQRTTSESWRQQLKNLGRLRYCQRLMHQIRNAQAFRIRQISKKYHIDESQLPDIWPTRQAMKEALDLANDIGRFL